MQVMAGIFKIKLRQTGMRDVASTVITDMSAAKRIIGLLLSLAGMPVTSLMWHNMAGRMWILGTEAGW